jgi:hypothetical protein
MPHIHTRKVTTYVVGLLCVAQNSNCSRLAHITNRSPDALSRILQSVARLSIQTILATIVRTLEKISEGYFIIDDTTVNKEYAKVIEKCYWLWSTNDDKFIFGYNVVVLVWSNGALTIPLAWLYYKKSKEKKDQTTKIELAQMLMKYAKQELKLATKYISFDSFYGAAPILHQCQKYGWTFTTKAKSNRVLDGKQLKKTYRHPYWEKTGTLSCKLRVKVVRHGKRYFITNDTTATKKEVRARYDARWKIEEVFRMLHDQVGLDECASRSFHKQQNHTALVMLTYTILATAKNSEPRTVYQLHDECMEDRTKAVSLVSEFMLSHAG